MRMKVFASRNLKELLRDPLNIAFALGFPLVVMALLTAIERGIPEAVFPIARIAPGMAVFGLSFITLFSATLIAKDRSTSFLVRLFASPLTPSDFIAGYILPLVPLSALQSAICLGAAAFLGLPLDVNLLMALVSTLPSALMFTGFGLLAGSLFNDKQVGGVCGALLTNLCAWLSGAWFELSLVGGGFQKAAYLLPFAHGVDAGRAALAGDYAGMVPHLLWVGGYAAAALAAAVAVFRRRMRANR